MRQVEITYIPLGWIHTLYFATYTRKKELKTQLGEVMQPSHISVRLVFRSIQYITKSEKL